MLWYIYRAVDEEEEEEENNEEGNPLLVPLEDKEEQKKHQATLWFGKVGLPGGKGSLIFSLTLLHHLCSIR